MTMSGKLLKELHKTRPFESPRQEAFLNVIRTADHLMRRFEELLKPHNISATQYNVLRILRGMCKGDHPEAGGATDGTPCKTIAQHMLTREPDITRLLDRLETRGLISRQRDHEDRRVVHVRITADGLAMLKELDGPVSEFHNTQFPTMGETEITRLTDLLEKARS